MRGLLVLAVCLSGALGALLANPTPQMIEENLPDVGPNPFLPKTVVFSPGGWMSYWTRGGMEETAELAVEPPERQGDVSSRRSAKKRKKKKKEKKKNVPSAFHRGCRLGDALRVECTPPRGRCRSVGELLAAPCRTNRFDCQKLSTNRAVCSSWVRDLPLSLTARGCWRNAHSTCSARGRWTIQIFPSCQPRLM